MAHVQTLTPQLQSSPDTSTSAPSPHTLSPSQISVIKSTVPVLAQHGETITTHFYKKMLSDKPELKTIFNTSNQANKRQPHALAGALYAYAANIDNLSALSGAVELIAQRHASLFVRPENYSIVGEYLLEAMSDILGPSLSPEVLKAWEAAYWQLADILIAKEQQLYTDAGDWADWRNFRIARKVKESPEITSFYLEPVDGKPLPDFKPGQYISIRTAVPQLGHVQPRQYSLSDTPNATHYRISVKREAGVSTDDPGQGHHAGIVSNILHDCRSEGDVVEVSHPFGDFYFDAAAADADAPVVMLSAGVGLTSTTSIFNSLLAEGTRRQISFVHGARRAELRAFADRYQDVARERPNVKVILFDKQDAHDGHEPAPFHRVGRVSVDRLDGKADLHLDDKRTEYFVCGPDSFMDDVQAGLEGMGVGKDRIHSEIYGPQR